MGAILATGKRTVTRDTRSDGIESGGTLSKLSPRLEPCSLVKFGSKSNVTDDVDNNVCSNWTNNHGDRRYNRTSKRQEDKS